MSCPRYVVRRWEGKGVGDKCPLIFWKYSTAPAPFENPGYAAVLVRLNISPVVTVDVSREICLAFNSHMLLDFKRQFFRFFWSLIHYNINISSLDFKHTISYCDEQWPELPFFDGRVYYSIFSLALQYFIPILVVTSAYMKIYYRLKKVCLGSIKTLLRNYKFITNITSH